MIIIKAQRFNSQVKNKEDALNRLIAIIKSAIVQEKPRKPTKPTTASKARRLESKSVQSRKKLLRRKVEAK